MGNRDDIHLINSLWNAASGSELRTITLYESIRARGRNAILWADRRPDPTLVEQFPIRRIRLFPGCFPRGGTQIFVGAYLVPGRWLDFSHPDRQILVHNTFTPERFQLWMERLGQGGDPVEVVYTSALLRESTGVPGPVHLSRIDIDAIRPAESRPPGTFTVGRLSRDIAYKHHPLDIPFYRRLAAAGMRVRLMGATCLESELGADPSIELLPAMTESLPDFLHSVDVFYYRTSDQWLEPLGRVIFEAMAAGVPVVCERRGGYVPYIENGRNGFLFDRDDEAFEMIETLRRDMDLREHVGREGRRTVEQLFSREAVDEMVAFYLRTDARS